MTSRMTKKIINLTPHDITIVRDDGNITIPKSGMVARVAEIVTAAPDINGIPCVATRMGEIQNLPAPEAGTVYIVSPLVAGATDRTDVVCPDTGSDSVVRDGNGNIRGVKRLRKILVK